MAVLETTRLKLVYKQLVARVLKPGPYWAWRLMLRVELFRDEAALRLAEWRLARSTRVRRLIGHRFPRRVFEAAVALEWG